MERNQRSKSLTQIHCLGLPEAELPRKGEMDNRPETEDITRCALATPPGDTSSHGPDRLIVLQPHGEEGNRRTRLLKLHHKMSSQEHFSITFDLLDDTEYEILPAIKGTSLRDVLQGKLEKRGLEAHQVAVYVDTSSTAIPLTYDTSRLGGNHLYIKYSNETTPVNVSGSSSNRVPASRTSSTGSREEKTRKISGSQRSGRRSALSTEDISDPAVSSLLSLHDGSSRASKTKASLARKSGIFSNASKTERMDSLTELLNQYSVSGLPRQLGLLTFDTPHDDIYRLENHWSDFVENSQELSKRMKNQQDAIWELLHTEVFYIRRLKVITDLFLACLCNLQSEGLLNEASTLSFITQSCF
ncbi:pleckstrin homology domain-containing family G member 5-like [Tachypleus tridentatus]|uniref:pleckstrin homology domain-containing family G member 5-like n=1 Tax=Tachypleus tridentatus TaxID=6853 RepID=UPI003FCFA906